MSTLEKAIELLQKMHEHKLETIYMYMRFVDSQPGSIENAVTLDGVSSENKAPSSITKKQKALEGLLSFAGTLPADFDYKQEIHADYIVTRNTVDFSTSDIPAVTPENMLKIFSL